MIVGNIVLHLMCTNYRIKISIILRYCYLLSLHSIWVDINTKSKAIRFQTFVILKICHMLCCHISLFIIQYICNIDYFIGCHHVSVCRFSRPQSATTVHPDA